MYKCRDEALSNFIVDILSSAASVFIHLFVSLGYIITRIKLLFLTAFNSNLIFIPNIVRMKLKYIEGADDK